MSNNKPADPRRGLPSASATERLLACPGSYLISKLVKPEEIPVSDDADAGRRIHAARESQDISDLDIDEVDLVKQMAEEEERIYHKWCDDYQITDAVNVQETRYWLWREQKRVCSAQVDFCAYSLSKRVGLILDRKSGRKGVTPPTRNWQLRTSAVILAANLNLVTVRVAIIQPFVRRQNPCDYGPDDIYGANGAWDQLNKLLDRVQDPKAGRTVGMHCEHCVAKHICPEAKAKVSELLQLKGMVWETLAPEKKLQLWQDGKIVEKILAHIFANIKSDVREGRIHGLGLSKETNPRTITSVVQAFKRLAAVLCNDEKDMLEFTLAFDTDMSAVSVGAIEEYVRKKKGLTKKAATEWVNKELKEIITTTKREGHVMLLEDKA